MYRCDDRPNIFEAFSSKAIHPPTIGTDIDDGWGKKTSPSKNPPQRL